MRKRALVRRGHVHVTSVTVAVSPGGNRKELPTSSALIPAGMSDTSAQQCLSCKCDVDVYVCLDGEDIVWLPSSYVGESAYTMCDLSTRPDWAGTRNKRCSQYHYKEHDKLYVHCALSNGSLLRYNLKLLVHWKPLRSSLGQQHILYPSV